LLALWTLVSSHWSDSSGRALIEFDRVLAYVLALIVFGSVATSRQRVRWLMRSVAFGTVVVSLAGLATRILPDVWHAAPTLQRERLSYPTTYSNTSGLVASIAIVLCLALASDEHESRLGRILGAAALPALAVTLLLTFSRGAIAAGIIGVVVLLVVARPRLALTGLAATVATTAVALIVAYHADQLATPEPVISEAVSQGHRVAFVVAACMAVSAVGRAVLLPLDELLSSYSLPRSVQRLKAPAVVLGVGALVAVAVAAGVPREIDNQYKRFVHAEAPVSAPDFRQRLTTVGGNRIHYWRTAVQGFRDERLRGDGAGTYQLYWDKHRPVGEVVRDGHSLYLEVAAELGIVGCVLLGGALIPLLVGTLWRARGHQRALYGAIFAAGSAWALQAGVDWQWEMPAVTLPILALLAASVAAKPPELTNGEVLSRGARVVISMGWLVLAVGPALLVISDGRILQATRAYNDRNDCSGASALSLSSLSVLANRPQPYELLGYCNVERGFPVSAMQAMQKAVQQDPHNWRYRYGLSIAQGAAGLDPRPEARLAVALNPRNPIARQALARLGPDARQWPAQSRQNADSLIVSGPVGAR
jgi:O-antigen ligase